MFHDSCFMLLCPRKVLTLRPLPCDGSALPLSYRGPVRGAPGVRSVGTCGSGFAVIPAARRPLPLVPAPRRRLVRPEGLEPPRPRTWATRSSTWRVSLFRHGRLLVGGDDRLRTGGLCGASAALCQLSYIPLVGAGPVRCRGTPSGSQSGVHGPLRARPRTPRRGERRDAGGVLLVETTGADPVPFGLPDRRSSAELRPQGPARTPDDQGVIALRVRCRALRAADGPYDAGATPLQFLLAVPSQPAVLLPPAFLQRTPTASAMLSGSRNPRVSAKTSPIGRIGSRPSAWRLTSRSYRVR
jgi:hypothetical protein